MLADCGLQHEVNGVMTCFFTLCHLHHKRSTGSQLLHLGTLIWTWRGKSKLVSTCIQESNQIILHDWTVFVRAWAKILWFLQSISSVTSLVLTSILLFYRKWQLRATECESGSILANAGVGRDRMRTGNIPGRSICALQAVLHANASLCECYPRHTQFWGSRQLSTAHS